MSLWAGGPNNKKKRGEDMGFICRRHHMGCEMIDMGETKSGYHGDDFYGRGRKMIVVIRS